MSNIEKIQITECQVGDIIRYKTSQKPYIVSMKTPKGYFLFSETQQYDSTINNFEVIRIVRGNGTLPEKFEDEKHNQLLIKVKDYLQTRTQTKSNISSKIEKQPTEIVCPEIKTTGTNYIIYPKYLTPNDKEVIKIGSESVEIPKCTMLFDKWNRTPFFDTLGHPKTISYDGIQMFAEHVIGELFIKSGWKARCIQVYGRKKLDPLFYNIWSDVHRTKQISIPIEDERIKGRLETIVSDNDSSYKGCWDVLGWKEDKILFVEAKVKKKDRINNNQKQWFCAGLKNGLTPDNFLIVEWDFAK